MLGALSLPISKSRSLSLARSDVFVYLWHFFFVCVVHYSYVAGFDLCVQREKKN